MNINLLPWRAEKKAKEKKLQHVVLAMSVCVAMLLLISLHGWLSIRVHSLELRLRALQRTFLIEDGGGEISETIDPVFSGVDTASAMNDAAHIRDTGACWRSIIHDAAGWKLTGIAFSPQAVTAVMRFMAESKVFENLHLIVLRKEPAKDYLQFVFSDQKSHTEASG